MTKVLYIGETRLLTIEEVRAAIGECISGLEGDKLALVASVLFDMDYEDFGGGLYIEFRPEIPNRTAQILMQHMAKKVSGKSA